MNVGRPEQSYQKGYQTFLPPFLDRRKQVLVVHNEYAGITQGSAVHILRQESQIWFPILGKQPDKQMAYL